MTLEIVKAAQQIEPLLLTAARRGQGPRAVFKRALRARQAQLGDADWLWLLVTLQALPPSPADARPARTECAPASLPAAYGHGK